jgi:hypothetical protein
MSYVSPTVNASGRTFSQLQAEGWAGHVERVIAANSLSQAQINIIRALISGVDHRQPLARGISTVITNWLAGAPIDTNEVNQRLLDYATALKVILAAIEEINTLVTSNAGTLHRTAGNVSAPLTRTWP